MPWTAAAFLSMIFTLAGCLGRTDLTVDDPTVEGPEVACTTPVGRVGGATSCCDDGFCRGYCDETWGCNCDGIVGGCTAPTICCPTTGACASEKACHE